MTADEKRIAIAEACGWAWHNLHPRFGEQSIKSWYYKDTDRIVFDDDDLPDYLNDLNAMHEAEKVLTRGQCIRFVSELCGIVGVKWRPTSHFDSIHATAAQRADAFLMTIGKLKA